MIFQFQGKKISQSYIGSSNILNLRALIDMSDSGTPRKIALSLFLFFICYFTQAQSLKDHLQKGDRYFLRKDYENALKSYQDALAADANDPYINYKAGISSLNQENFSQAVEYLVKAYALKPDVDDDISYHLGVAFQKDHQYAKARQQFETLRGKNKRLAPLANRKIQECITGDTLMRIKVNADVEPVAGDVNTDFSELAPLLTDDGNTLVFTSTRSSDDFQVKSGTNSGDVYVAVKRGNEWTGTRRIGEQINVKMHESATSVSADGKTLFIYYEDGRGDIYTSTSESGSWSRPVPLNKFINHPAYRESSACVSGDGQKLFFSSNRPGGKGGFDIYVSVMGADGQWGRPSNLGSAINTRGDEESPFIDSASETLYFSSDGQPTLGDKDIFKSQFSAGKWLPPENLGYPINTSGFESDFVLSGDKRFAYFTSRRGGAGHTDIYQIRFLDQGPAAQPQATVKKDGHQDAGRIVTILKGTVIDAASATPLEATLRLVDNSTRITVETLSTDTSGTFQVNIPREGNYGLTTERSGYLFNSMNFNLPAFEKYQEIDTHILMVKASVGSKMVLENIFFDFNDSSLKPESMSELENIKDLLSSNPQWRIQINGHTDNIGAREANVVLSLKRAQAVVAHLVRQGIPADRLHAKGYGPDHPLVSNDDERDGRQINRRTEIEIISK